MKTPVPVRDYTRRPGDSRPLDRATGSDRGSSLDGEEAALSVKPVSATAALGTSVSEIHRYPLRPPGFEEPLFPTPGSRRAVAEHLLGAPWLCRASELSGGGGETVHVLGEPVELRRSDDHVHLIRSRRGRRCSWRRRRVTEILERWREVEAWWDDELRIDRLVFRVLLSGGGVVDLARDESGWFLSGIVD